MAIFGWNAIGGKIIHFIEGTNAVGKYLDGVDLLMAKRIR
jgi:hypothetical protein